MSLLIAGLGGFMVGGMFVALAVDRTDPVVAALMVMTLAVPAVLSALAFRADERAAERRVIEFEYQRFVDARMADAAASKAEARDAMD